jgi:hypothetical protein
MQNKARRPTGTKPSDGKNPSWFGVGKKKKEKDPGNINIVYIII